MNKFQSSRLLGTIANCETLIRKQMNRDFAQQKKDRDDLENLEMLRKIAKTVRDFGSLEGLYDALRKEGERRQVTLFADNQQVSNESSLKQL